MVEKNNNEDFEQYGMEKTKEMLKYEKETGKYAIWRGQVTEGFKKWLKGEKIYFRDKERISLYVPEKTKNKWLDFINNNGKYTSISKLIRESVDQFINNQEHIANTRNLSNISHALKEPLTTIKGFSQLLLENYRAKLSDEVFSTIKNIFEQSIYLENIISEFIEEIKEEPTEYDILLIEDHNPTLKLIISYVQGKGRTCKGVISGNKAKEELKYSRPKIILLDILLPDISGYVLCKEIKSDEKFKDTLVYFLTAIPESEVEKKLEESGADGYILKPFDLADIDEILDKI